MPDILEGDFLVVGSREYPIKSCAEWNDSRLNTLSFAKMANITASTKRIPPVGADGKRGVPTTNLSTLKCMPLDPIDPDLKQRLALDTPHELLQTIVTDGNGFVQLILEDLKK